MTDTVRYQVTRLGTRYGVHVDNLTKDEARDLMCDVADVIELRAPNTISLLARNDIICRVENPTSLDPPPSYERWFNRFALGFIAFGIIFYAFHDIIRDLLK